MLTAHLVVVVLAGVYATPPEGAWDHRYPYAPLQKDLGPVIPYSPCELTHTLPSRNFR